MDYQFPTINHIADVLPAIKDKPEFIVVTKPEGYTVINYAYASGDTFDINNPMLMECRGLIFDTNTGKLLRRAFHKFFNLGEKEWTRNIDLSKPHRIEEKLDGSMITPIMLDGEVYWTTKMGITDVSLKCQDYVDGSLFGYIDLAKFCIKHNATPIFEWCDKNTPIVIKHKENSLTLLAIRDNYTGNYYPRNYIVNNCSFFSVPFIGGANTEIELEELSEKVKILDDTEGIVINFDDGHRIKVKTDWYVGIHRFKDETSSLRKLVKLILEGKIDDALPALPDTDRKEVETKVDKFWTWFNMQVHALELINLQHTSKFLTKKELALHLQQAKTPRWLNAIYYRTYEGDDVSESFKKMILSNCNQESVFNEASLKLSLEN